MVNILLAQGFEEIEAIGVIDILRRANIDVNIVSVNNTQLVEGGHKISIKADVMLDEIVESDMLVLPGGLAGVNNLKSNDNVKKLILNYNKQYKYIAAICAAPTILSELGLLKDKSAVCHTDFITDLDCIDVPDQKVVEDKNIITSRGAGTVFDFAYKIVDILKDENTSSVLKKAMIFNG